MNYASPVELRAIASAMLAPPADVRLSEWAAEHFRLSSEASAEPRKFTPFPFQVEPLDCLAPNSPYPETVLVWASQTGKTSIQLAHLAYIIAEDPRPVLFVEPNLAMVEAVSKDRLAPMFRDVPVIQGKVSDPKARDSGSTIYNRRFIGGQVSLVGSNSPAGLAGRPVRYLELDEVDRFEASAGAEGDPVDLAIARARTFWNRKVVMASSPTVKGHSRIEAAWLDSDQRDYHVPCPRCKVPQVLEWERIEWPENEPEEAAYRCAHCEQLIPHHEKARMVARGRWNKGNPSSKVAGFRLSELYSPWRSWGDMAVDWLKVQGNPERTRVFWNTSLARWWSDEEQRGTDINTLLARRESYGPDLAAGVAVLTVGVDIGGDRLELELVGWGRGEESWSVEYRVLPGDPAGAQVWRDLDEYLMRTWRHPKAGPMPVHACCVDSGFSMDRVLNFTRERFGRHLFAVKGKEASVQCGRSDRHARPGPRSTSSVWTRRKQQPSGGSRSPSLGRATAIFRPTGARDGLSSCYRKCSPRGI